MKPVQKDSRFAVILAFGANLASEFGAPEATIRAATRVLDEVGLFPRALSALYRTPCFPAGAGPDYVNAAALCETALAPDAVLAVTTDLESRFGRLRDNRWGNRTLDVDLLAVDDLILPDQETFDIWRGKSVDEQQKQAPDHLILPHPRIQDRPFVLIPMNDVAPDWRHPVLNKTVSDMVKQLSVEQIQEIKPIAEA